MQFLQVRQRCWASDQNFKHSDQACEPFLTAFGWVLCLLQNRQHMSWMTRGFAFLVSLKDVTC